jgi:uncharacterized protein with HEPN domain
MSKERTYIDYVRDIVNEINRIENFIKNLSYDEFVKDEKTIYAVIRCFEVMGEAAKNIPKQIRDKYSILPWKRISGMRDKLIHEYFGVDYETLWQTIKKRIPEIKPSLGTILKDMGDKK